MDPNPFRLLWLQNSSVFDGFGGIEYYQDDVLQMAGRLWGQLQVDSVVLLHREEPLQEAKGYGVHFVGVKPRRFVSPLQNRYWPPFFLKARSLAKEKEPNLIVAGHLALGPLVHALGRSLNIPYAVVAYGIEAWGDLLPQDRWALQRAHRIISISEWTKAMLVKQGFAEDRIRIIHPALPQCYEKFPAPRHSGRKADRPFTLLTVSRLEASERYKGHDHVLHALYRLKYSDPDLKLRYLIQGDGSDRPRLEELCNELGLEDRVEFRPAVRDRSQFETVYREADVYVMPSRFGHWDGRWRGEGFGIVYLEAAAFGVPSIAYDCGGATDIISHGKNGLLVVPDSITDLANAIAQVAQKPAVLEAMGKEAHRMVMERFIREAVSKEVNDALFGFPRRRR